MADPQLVTLARARQSPRLTGLDDAALTELIAAASNAIEDWCNRSFALASRTEVFDGDNDRELLLKAFPVVTLTSVTITDADGTATVVPLADLVRRDAIGELEFVRSPMGLWNRFAAGQQNVAVVYTGGFDPIPAAVRQATVEMAIHLYARSTRDMNVSGERIGSYSYTARGISDAGEIPDGVRALIAPYRDHRV